MRALLLALSFVLSGCATSDTTAQDSAPSTEPTGEPAPLVESTERLNVEIPAGWITGLTSQTSKLRLVEYYPPDTADEWRDKLAIEAMSGEALPDPLDFVNGWANDQARLCDPFNHQSIFAGYENGYPTVVHLFECGVNERTGKPIVTMAKVIQGNQSLYTITRIWRLGTPIQATESSQEFEIPIDKNLIAAWSNALRQVTVCDSARAEHRCP